VDSLAGKRNNESDAVTAGISFTNSANEFEKRFDRKILRVRSEEARSRTQRDGRGFRERVERKKCRSGSPSVAKPNVNPKLIR
jgi:hypothetical protein